MTNSKTFFKELDMSDHQLDILNQSDHLLQNIDEFLPEMSKQEQVMNTNFSFDNKIIFYFDKNEFFVYKNILFNVSEKMSLIFPIKLKIKYFKVYNLKFLKNQNFYIGNLKDAYKVEVKKQFYMLLKCNLEKNVFILQNLKTRNKIKINECSIYKKKLNKLNLFLKRTTGNKKYNINESKNFIIITSYKYKDQNLKDIECFVEFFTSFKTPCKNKDRMLGPQKLNKNKYSSFNKTANSLKVDSFFPCSKRIPC